LQKIEIKSKRRKECGKIKNQQGNRQVYGLTPRENTRIAEASSHLVSMVERVLNEGMSPSHCGRDEKGSRLRKNKRHKKLVFRGVGQGAGGRDVAHQKTEKRQAVVLSDKKGA